MRRIKAVEFSRFGPQLCATTSAPAKSVFRDFRRSTLLTGTYRRPLISRELRRSWRAFATRAFFDEPEALSTRAIRQSSRVRRPVPAVNSGRESATPFEVIALSLFCAAIGPAVAILLFILMENHWG
jgi:hypothetical protein